MSTKKKGSPKRRVNRDNLRATLKQASQNGKVVLPPEIKEQVEEVYRWELLKEQYENLKDRCAAPAVLIPYLRDPRIAAKITNVTEITRVVTLLLRDTTSLLESLNRIHAKHQSKTGVASDPDAMMDMIQIAEEYVDWTHKFDSVVLSNLSHAFEIITKAGGTPDRSVLEPASEKLTID